MKTCKSMLRCIQYYRMALVFCALGLMPMMAWGANETRASSVSQNGITWYFSGEHPVGQYANGDWWVQGPVEINRITPESRTDGGRVMHGTMLNPRGDRQGYDSHPSDMGYSDTLNVDPGNTGTSLTLNSGSVVSSISKTSPNERGRPLLSDLAILTVVRDIPKNGAFRPSPYSDDDDRVSQWTEADLRYSVLRSLPRPSSAPELANVTESVKRFWNEQDTGWTARAVHAENNQPLYGREIANVMGRALASLHLDYSESEKRDLFVYVVQYGLDIYDRVLNGGVWEDLGGHNHGRKMPMLFAGFALGADEIIEKAGATDPLRFAEDRQTWIVSESDVGREVLSPRETYRQEDVGMAEWGAQHTRNPTRDDRSWGARYRWVGGGFMYHGLVASFFEDGVDAWNHPAFFAYIERYAEIGSPSSGANAIEAFAEDLWDLYWGEDISEFQGRSPKPPVLSVY